MPSPASRLVPRAIRQLSSASPDVRVSLHVPSPGTTWSWASTGQCDIGLVRPRSGYAGVDCEPYLTVDAVCALPRQHALVRRRTIAVSDLAGVPLIAGAPGFQQAIEETFARAGVEPRFAFMAQYTAARCGLLAEGLGLAIVAVRNRMGQGRMLGARAAGGVSSASEEPRQGMPSARIDQVSAAVFIVDPTLSRVALLNDTGPRVD